MVNQCIVEELLQEICELDFGHHTAAIANLGLWRSRGDHHAFVGEFAFQLRFDGPDGISPKALHACQRFFIERQHTPAEWLALPTPTPRAVYTRKSNTLPPPNATRPPTPPLPPA